MADPRLLGYAELVQKAGYQGAVLDANNAQVQRIRKISERLLPYAAKFNERAKDWKWEVNVLRSPTINAFCMPGGKIAFFTGIIEQLKLTDDEIAMIMATRSRTRCASTRASDSPNRR